MTKQEALNVLIASVYCESIDLLCEDCPHYVVGEDNWSCKSNYDLHMLEAVKILREVNLNESGTNE